MQPRHRIIHRPGLRLSAAALAAVLLVPAVSAQSVKPNRYSQPPPATTGTDARSNYERQRQTEEQARERQAQTVRRAERDRVALAIDANRQRLEADRARTERQRVGVDAAESERLRQAFEARRQGYEREREALERQRAQAETQD